jgi:alcohol dehydrogenase
VTALTGIDAISHAIETYVTKRRNAISQAFSREAWRHLGPNFPRVLAEPNNLTARAEMQLGACLAGLAIENSMLGAAHALANPLTAEFGVVHGEAVALMLPHVIRFNGAHDVWIGECYRDLLRSSGHADGQLAGRDAPELLATMLRKVSREAGIASTLGERGVTADRLPELAAAAAQQWTGTFNPVEVSRDEFQRLYEAALS